MPRLARAVVPGFPHHLTQRGNRRQETFFEDADYERYIDYASCWTHRSGVEIWAYCLMPNHVHHAAVPGDQNGLRNAFGEAHRRYTSEINERHGWKGCLWQGRFSSFVMDERYLLAAVRYIELNPVAAGLVRKPEDWPWSSARAHLNGRDDALVKVAPMLERVPNWREFLRVPPSDDEIAAIREHQRLGRPLGSDEFVDRMESALGRVLRPRKPGPIPAVDLRDLEDAYCVPGSPSDGGLRGRIERR